MQKNKKDLPPTSPGTLATSFWTLWAMMKLSQEEAEGESRNSKLFPGQEFQNKVTSI